MMTTTSSARTIDGSSLHYGRLAAFWILAAISAPGQQLMYSTFLGGANSDIPHAMTVDQDGNVYVTGETWSSDFPVSPGALQSKHGGIPSNMLGFFTPNAPDAFVTKLSPDGSRVIWSTYLGGSGSDTATAIAVDRQGNVYVAGRTSSPDFPTTRGAWQTQAAFDPPGGTHGFAAKLNSSGTALLYSTLLAGSRFDSVSGLAVDRDGGAVVVGNTSSPDFPITPGAFQDEMRQDNLTIPMLHGFIAKLNVDGSALVYSSFLSGTRGSNINGVAIDAAGFPLVAGTTVSPDFPVTPGAFDATFSGQQQAFAAKVHPRGTALIWSTFLGSEQLAATALAVSPDGSLSITGNQAPEGRGPAFLVELTGDGQFIHSTVHGGTLGASPTSIAIDPAGNTYIAGFTFSGDLPATSGASGPAYDAAPCFRGLRTFIGYMSAASNCGDGFVARVNAQGTSIVTSTYFGGNDADAVYGIAASGPDDVVIAGYTRSSNLPATPGVVQMQRALGICTFTSSPSAFTANECEDGFVARFHFGAPLAQPLEVVNAGSRIPGAIMPGALVRVLGAGIAETQVGFDEVNTPVVEAFTDLVVTVPAAMAGRKHVRVRAGSRTADVEVAPVSPGVLIANRQNNGQAAMLNQDLSVNGPRTPALTGTIVSMFVTGVLPPEGVFTAGTLNPDFATGSIVGVVVYVGSLPAEVLFAGQAPTLDPGVQQITFRVPPLIAGQQPVFVIVGPVQSSQPGVSMWVAN